MKLALTLFTFILIGYVCNSQIVSGQETDPKQLVPIVSQEGMLLPLEKPADFPKITVHVADNPSPGYLLMNSFNQSLLSPKYIMVVDSLGEPIHYKKTLAPSLDFKLQQNGLYSYAQAIAPGETHVIGGKTVRNAKAINYILDPDFNLYDSVQCKNGYLSDPHEFLILPNGHYLTLAYESVPVDMSTVVDGGEPNAVVIGTVIQELDNKKNCVFQWRSLDNLPLTHTFANVRNPSFEHVHGNSYYLDTDGNLIVSFTASFDIVKIDLVNGDIKWHFGGKKNDFEITGDDSNLPFHFTNQHDIKRLPNGNFLFYDNGFAKSNPYSRAVEFSVDEANKKANLVWDYRRDPDISAFAMGSAQRLRNGNTLIDWGMIFSGDHRALTEVNKDNEVVYEISLPAETYSYRGYKYEYPLCQPVADVTIPEAFEGNTYEFKNQNGNTGAELMITSLDAFMYNNLTLKKYECGALKPEFEGEAPVVIPNRYTFKTQMVYSIAGELKFDISQLPARYDYSILKVYHRQLEGSGIFKELSTQLDEDGDYLVAMISDTGEYVIGFKREAEKINPPALMKPANNAALLNNSAIQLLWSSTGRFDHFKLELAADEDFNEVVATADSLKSTAFSTSLENNKNYFWRVKAYYSNLESEWSGVRQFTITDSLLLIDYPKEVDILYIDSVEVIRWTTNLKDSLSIVLYKAGEKLMVIKDSLFSYTNAYAWKVPKSIQPGDDYSILISSIKDNEIKSDSYNIRIIDNSTGIYEENDNNYLVVTPSPASDFIEITGSEGNIWIFNYLGECVSQHISSQHRQESMLNLSVRMDVSQLPEGVYFVKTMNKIQKFIKL